MKMSRKEGPGAKWTSWPIVVPIRAYQLLLSPFLGRNCRFAPSCSQYAIEAYRRFGLVRGTVLSVRRLGRCHPMGSSGYDPVPTQWGS